MDGDMLDRVQFLTDCELTILSCQIAGEHAIFTTSSNIDLATELDTVLHSTFTIGAALLRCTSDTTIDDFNESMLVQHNDIEHNDRLRQDSTTLDERGIQSIAILANLDQASDAVQIQIIDLLRTRRIYTRSAMHTAPKELLLLITLSHPDARLIYHLNDMIAVSHDFDAQDQRSEAGISSIITHAEVDLLRTQALQARLTAEVDAYLYNVVLFMRMSRYVQAGVSATATRQMRVLCKALAALHGIDFITPSIVMLAARKVYPHRLVLATATTEKSLQWGSDPAAVQKLLEEMTIPKIIEEVIASVETPL